MQKHFKWHPGKQMKKAGWHHQSRHMMDMWDGASWRASH